MLLGYSTPNVNIIYDSVKVFIDLSCLDCFYHTTCLKCLLSIKFLVWLAGEKRKVHVGAFPECAVHSALISHISASTLHTCSLVDDTQSGVLKMDMGKDDNGLLMRHAV